GALPQAARTIVTRTSADRNLSLSIIERLLIEYANRLRIAMMRSDQISSLQQGPPCLTWALPFCERDATILCELSQHVNYEILRKSSYLSPAPAHPASPPAVMRARGIAA
ncbi:hypothetical protein K2Z83_28410, partial [Oscillochloris sp. ZM17-4]|uniref:hypothetical protein n=1 Tax=Oscillochloris sp. ZM17-4 TaxID=2866714 RepID=UPI001C735EBA